MTLADGNRLHVCDGFQTRLNSTDQQTSDQRQVLPRDVLTVTGPDDDEFGLGTVTTVDGWRISTETVWDTNQVHGKCIPNGSRLRARNMRFATNTRSTSTRVSLVDSSRNAVSGLIDNGCPYPAGYPPMWLISTLVTPVVSDVRLSE
mgnify:CR=1 FL=1|jgi:hypothetical protein